jgi:hypothetical protein
MRIKYPRTMNLPWSGSESSDDVWWKDCAPFEGKEVVVTEKMDGECTTFYTDGTVHARSLETTHHPSRSWVKALVAGVSYRLPGGWRVCGENMFAWHSIFYTELPGYLLGFGIYDNQNMCISWDDVVYMCEDLGIPTVPVLYRGVWDEEKIREVWTGRGTFPTFASKVEDAPEYPKDFEPCEAEGYVVRLARAFHYEEFRDSCAKYVRPHHVTTSEFWMQRPVLPNKLRED